MGDIVERLKAIPLWMVGMMAPGWQEQGTAAYEAADAIESLRAENANLEERLVVAAYDERVLRDEVARLTEERDALATVTEIFVGHGRALGAYGCDPGTFWVYTHEGHRKIPASDFVFARDALAKIKGGPDAR